MLAIDTNVLVRFVTDDHPEQARAARVLIESSEVLISTTVLLETEWVLRSSYRFGRPDVLTALRSICALPDVTLTEPGRVAVAFAWSQAGMDFADALHLAAAEDVDAFVTFDRELAKSASDPATPTIRLL